MNIADHIYEQVKLMPDTVAGEVLNFIEFLEFRRKPAVAVFQGQNHFDDHSVLETFYLMQSPANAEWLQKGIEQHRRGEVQEIEVMSYLD